MAKIGVGIITCNRLDYLRNLLKTLPKDQINELVVVNDGKPQLDYVETEFEFGLWIDNPVNLGVGKSKNKAMKHLYDAGCDYIFIIEDDMLIKDENVFDKYIETYKKSGIHHFNYGPGSPFNRKQNIALYINGAVSNDQELLKLLGKYKTGKGCLYINKLSEIDLDVLKEIIQKGLQFD
jgi:glycosyltransferase involved in cell wall biosynthesis